MARRKPAKSGKSDQGQIRIIAGDWRGRKLPVANVPGLRPTPDRVRETVFNWLMPYLPGARVLDCFSGTGALSFEALSRGAKEAVMIEQASAAASALKDNLSLLKASNGTVVESSALVFLKRPCPEPFDVIFLDPPFRQGMLKDTCQMLHDNGYLHDQSILYIEVEKELNPLPVPDNWQILKFKQAGQIAFQLLSC